MLTRLGYGCSRRILVFDGAPSALSQLIIVREIMNRLQWDQNLEKLPYPWQIYDMVVGTGQGGIAAILLGRLRMSADDAISAYTRLCSSYLPAQRPQDRESNSQSFRSVFEDILRQTGHSIDEKMLEFDSDCCRVVVLTTCAANMSYARRLHNYPTRNSQSSNATITECVMATSASPFVFQPVVIERERFLDGTVCVPNPIKETLLEAQQAFGDASRASLILSIGAGRKTIISLPPTEELETLSTVFQLVAMDCERAHEDISRSLSESRGYHRLNVQRGLEDQACWKDCRQGDVTTHAMAYLHETAVSRKVDRVVAILLKESGSGMSLTAINAFIVFQGKKRKSSRSSSPSKRRYLLSSSKSATFKAADPPTHDDHALCEAPPAYDNANIYARSMRVPKTNSESQERIPHWSRWILDPVGFGFPIFVVAALWCDTRLGGPGGIVSKGVWSVA